MDEINKEIGLTAMLQGLSGNTSSAPDVFEKKEEKSEDN